MFKKKKRKQKRTSKQCTSVSHSPNQIPGELTTDQSGAD